MMVPIWWLYLVVVGAVSISVVGLTFYVLARCSSCKLSRESVAVGSPAASSPSRARVSEGGK